MENRLYLIHLLSALHVGSGQGSGVIDLPIARERATALPLVPGSSLKGVLREAYRPDLDDLPEDPPEDLPKDLPEEPLADAPAERPFSMEAWTALFGPETQNVDSSPHAGALAVGDGRLLCLPVRALRGTFAYVTCPMVLRRYQRDLQHTSATRAFAERAIPALSDGQCAVTSTSALLPDQPRAREVVLEDLDLTHEPERAESCEGWAQHLAEQLFPTEEAWRALFCERFAIVADGIFDFLAETALEIRTRIRIDPESRTVQQGALWSEENLPAESLLWGIVATERSRRPPKNGDNTMRPGAREMMALLETHPNGIDQRLQIGGNATVGRGQCRWILLPKPDQA